MVVADSLCDVLAAQRVAVVFGVMGHGNLLVVPRLTDRGIRYLGARHEGNAVAMCDGYARTSRHVGVCTVTQGPGLANTATALTTAARAGTPLIVLAGEGPDGPDNFQRFDQDGFFSLLGVPSLRIDDPTTAAERLSEAFDIARNERRPVGVNMPGHVLGLPCAGDVPPFQPATLEPVLPDTGAVARAANLIQRSRQPAIVAGRGAVAAHAGAELAALAELIGAVVATSLPAKDLFAGNPFAVGIAGGFATPTGARLLREADCVLAFGASLNSFTTDHGDAFDQAATLVRVDTTPHDDFGWTAAVEMVIGDAQLTARALRNELELRGHRADGFRTEEVAGILARRLPQDDFEDESDTDTLDPRTAVIALDDLLPRERTVVVDGGNCQGFGATYLSVPNPDCFVHPMGFGAIGCGLGAAIGAAVACPDKLSVLVTGDGALAMSSSDLDSSIRFGVPLVVVVLNDGAFGAELHSLRGLGLSDREARLDNPDFAALARAVGGRGVTLRTLADLPAVSEALQGLETLLVVDCHVTDYRADWNLRLEDAWRRLSSVAIDAEPVR
jgi:thiamine pyrophosphate-dependent acetolactate synthase large subunit-like protein